MAKSPEAERLRRIARELKAEADRTDAAAQERAEAYERLAAAAEYPPADEAGDSVES